MNAEDKKPITRRSFLGRAVVFLGGVSTVGLFGWDLLRDEEKELENSLQKCEDKKHAKEIIDKLKILVDLRDKKRELSNKEIELVKRTYQDLVDLQAQGKCKYTYKGQPGPLLSRDGGTPRYVASVYIKEIKNNHVNNIKNLNDLKILPVNFFL